MSKTSYLASLLMAEIDLIPAQPIKLLQHPIQHITNVDIVTWLAQLFSLWLKCSIVQWDQGD